MDVWPSHATVQLALPPRWPAMTCHGPTSEYGPSSPVISFVIVAAGRPSMPVVSRPKYMTQDARKVSGSRCPGSPYSADVHAVLTRAPPAALPCADGLNVARAPASNAWPAASKRCLNSLRIAASAGSLIAPKRLGNPPAVLGGGIARGPPVRLAACWVTVIAWSATP